MQSWCDSWAQKRSIGKRRHGSPNGWKNGPKKSEQFFLFAQASSTFHTISPYFTIIWVSWSKRSSSSTGGQPVLPWRWSLFAASNSEAFPGRSRLSRGKWNMFLPLSQQSFHHHLSDIAPSIFLYSQLQGWVMSVCYLLLVDQLYHLHFTSIAKLNLKYHLPQAAGCCLESFEVAFKFSRFVWLGIQESTWCLHVLTPVL